MILLAPGTTDTSIDVQVVDDSGLPVTGLVAATFPDVFYSKGAGASSSALSLSDLSALTDAHADGGLKERAGGVYRLDLPDAVASTAAAKVTLWAEETDLRLVAPAIQVGYLAWNAAWDAEVQSEVADALAAYDGPTHAEVILLQAQQIAFLHGRRTVIFVDATDGDDVGRAGLTPSDAVETIAGADALATDDDLIYLLPSATAYSSINTDKFVYASPGATIEGSGTSPLFLAGATLIGDGAVTVGTDQIFYFCSTNNSRDKFRCRSLIGSNSDSLIEMGSVTGAKCVVEAETIQTTTGNLAQTGGDSEINVKCKHMAIDGFLSSTSAGKVTIECDTATCTAASPVEGTGGEFNFRGNLKCTHAGTLGLNAPNGVKVVAERGSVESTTGRPHLTTVSGGTLQVAGGFGYDPARVTNGGTFLRNAQFPLALADSGATAPLRTGADGDTGESLSDQLDGKALETSVQEIITAFEEAEEFPTPEENAAAVRTELTTELGLVTTNLDAKVSEVEGGGGSFPLDEAQTENFVAFCSANTGGKSIDDFTTPKTLNVTVPQ